MSQSQRPHIENSIYIKYPDKKIHEDKVSWWLSGSEWDWELMRRGFLLWVIKMYIYSLLDCIKTFLMVVTIVLLRRNSWTMILSKKWEVISFNFQCVEFILHCAIKKPFSLCDSVPPNRQILGYLSTWQYSQPIFVSFTLHNYSRKGLERKGIKKNRPQRK